MGSLVLYSDKTVAPATLVKREPDSTEESSGLGTAFLLGSDMTELGIKLPEEMLRWSGVTGVIFVDVITTSPTPSVDFVVSSGATEFVVREAKASGESAVLIGEWVRKRTRGPEGQQPRQRELEWLRNNRDILQQHLGKWVVVEDNTLVAADYDYATALRTAKQTGIRVPFIFKLSEEFTVTGFD